MDAPQWRLQILARVKSTLRALGFRGSGTGFWKVSGNRRIMVKLVGGSNPKDTSKLMMEVYVGVDFLDLLTPEKTPCAYTALWHGRLGWTNRSGDREVFWRAYSSAEATDLADGITSALLPMLARVEDRFRSWHDVLIYLDPDVRETLDPPGQVVEWKLPRV